MKGPADWKDGDKEIERGVLWIRKQSGLDEEKENKKRRKCLAAKTNSSSADENANLSPSLFPPFIPLFSFPFPLSVGG